MGYGEEEKGVTFLLCSREGAPSLLCIIKGLYNVASRTREGGRDPVTDHQEYTLTCHSRIISKGHFLTTASEALIYPFLSLPRSRKSNLWLLIRWEGILNRIRKDFLKCKYSCFFHFVVGTEHNVRTISRRQNWGSSVSILVSEASTQTFEKCHTTRRTKLSLTNFGKWPFLVSPTVMNT